MTALNKVEAVHHGVSRRMRDAVLSMHSSCWLLNIIVMNLGQGKHKVLGKHLMGPDRPNLDQALELLSEEVVLELEPGG